MRPGRSKMGLALAMVLACTTTASATPLQDAWRHYQALEYDQALVALADVERNAASPAQLADALLLEGFVKIALARPDEAVLAFRQALRRVPTLRPPQNSSPRLVTVFEQARALEDQRTARRAKVKLELEQPVAPEVALRAFDVVTTVSSAYAGLAGTVSLVDRSTHVAATLPLVATDGARFVAHVPAPFAAIGATLDVSASLVDEGDTIATTPARAVTIPDHAAALRIESPLSGALVFVDGALAGTVPLGAPVPIGAGRHRVELRSSQGRVAQELVAAAGEVERVQLQVAPRPRLPIVRYALIGIGAALAITGGVLFDQANRATTRYNDQVVRDPTSGLPTTNYAAAAPFESTAHGYLVGAIVLVSIGGAAMATGIGLFGVRPDARDRVRLALDERGAGVRF